MFRRKGGDQEEDSRAQEGAEERLRPELLVADRHAQFKGLVEILDPTCVEFTHDVVDVLVIGRPVGRQCATDECVHPVCRRGCSRKSCIPDRDRRGIRAGEGLHPLPRHSRALRIGRTYHRHRGG